MRKIIDGKAYDTDTAKEIATASWNLGTISYCEETLYRKRTGEFFLWGEGGPMSRYQVSSGLNQWSGSTQIVPLTEKRARAWVEKHANDRYEEVFGTVPE